LRTPCVRDLCDRPLRGSSLAAAPLAGDPVPPQPRQVWASGPEAAYGENRITRLLPKQGHAMRRPASTRGPARLAADGSRRACRRCPIPPGRDLASHPVALSTSVR